MRVESFVPVGAKVAAGATFLRVRDSGTFLGGVCLSPPAFTPERGHEAHLLDYLAEDRSGRP